MKHYIGIDLGGTNIKGALVNENGEIVKQNTCPAHAEQGVEAVTENIANMIRDLAKDATVDGVSLGCPGTVDDKAGTVVYACNIGWVDYDVRSALKELTGYDVCLVNDANSAALAEVAAGAAKGAESAVVVTLGTGVGGGVDGRTAFAAQQAGNPAGEEVVREYVYYLTIGIANIVNIFFPEVIALSGGIANQGENLLVPLREKVQKQEYGAAYATKHPRIVCCTLGNTAGMIGAAMFTKDKIICVKNSFGNWHKNR